MARGPFHTESESLSGRPIEPPPYPEFRLPRGLWEEKTLDLDRFSRPLRAAGAKRWSLPLWPVWDGFLLNTALYAALAAGVVLVPRHTLRGWRRRRRACEACGYPVRVSEVCTECGATLRVAGERRSA